MNEKTVDILRFCTFRAFTSCNILIFPPFSYFAVSHGSSFPTKAREISRHIIRNSNNIDYIALETVR